MAARRISKYWTRRIQILGSIRAFLPLTSIHVENSKTYIGIGAEQLHHESIGVAKIEEETSVVAELVSAASLGFLSLHKSQENEGLENAERFSNVPMSISQALSLGFMQTLPGHDDQGRGLI